MRKPLIYLCGPYSHGDPVANTHAMMAAWDDLMSRNNAVYLCPHWSLFQHFLSPKPYNFWIDYDIQLILHCDALYRLFQSTPSPGSDIECAFARTHSIPIFTDLSLLTDFITNYLKTQRETLYVTLSSKP